jgi:hypothetical protein
MQPFVGGLLLALGTYHASFRYDVRSLPCAKHSMIPFETAGEQDILAHHPTTGLLRHVTAVLSCVPCCGCFCCR